MAESQESTKSYPVGAYRREESLTVFSPLLIDGARLSQVRQYFKDGKFYATHAKFRGACLSGGESSSFKCSEFEPSSATVKVGSKTGRKLRKMFGLSCLVYGKDRNGDKSRIRPFVALMGVNNNRRYPSQFSCSRYQDSTGGGCTCRGAVFVSADLTESVKIPNDKAHLRGSR